MRSKSLDLTKGSVTKVIILFALPLLFGNLFQQAYNLADTAIAGHLLGDDALSAIGASSVLCNFMMYFIGGMNGGFVLIIAKLFGADDIKGLKKSIASMIVFNVIISVVTILLALTATKTMMHFINTPVDVFNDSYRYVIILFLGVGVTSCYNAQASFLRALGNSLTPIVFLVIASIVNIGLDFLFIAGFKLGVMGASLATVIAQLISCILCFIVIRRDYKQYRPTVSDFKYDKALYNEMFFAGITMALMNCIFAIGSLILQSAINGLGKAKIAGHLAARKIAEMFMQPMTSMAASCSTFVSQNYGAKQFDRIKKAIKSSVTINISLALLFTLIVYVFANGMINVVTNTKNLEIIQTARQYLYINLPFYIFLGTLYVLRTSIQSIGKRIPPLVSSTIELTTKIVAAFVLTKAFGYIGVCVAEPISWVLGCLLLVFSFTRALKSISY